MDQISDSDALRNWKNPINGNEIMEYFHIPASKVLAVIKDAVKEAILEGEIPYEHDAAWEYVLRIAPELIKKRVKALLCGKILLILRADYIQLYNPLGEDEAALASCESERAGNN